MTSAEQISRDPTRPRGWQLMLQTILDRDVSNPAVLSAMAKIDRRLFVPAENRRRAFDDGPLPIGFGQTISQPYIVAAMTALLADKFGGSILEIGTGSGYQTAILSLLFDRVVSLERVAQLSARARKTLTSMKLPNIELVVADGSLGEAGQAPYDAILVTAAGPRIPQSLRDQLAYGGRMVLPIGPRHVQSLKSVDRLGAERFSEIHHMHCSFVPLIGTEGWHKE